MRRLVVAGAIAVLLAGVLAVAKDKKAPTPTSSISFVILKSDNGKPVRNAAVVLHPVNDDDKQEKGGLELKTDPEGKASYDGVPYGKLRIQVLAHGFQTYGGDYDIGQPTTEITIKLLRPVGQYSIYQDRPADDRPDPPQK